MKLTFNVDQSAALAAGIDAPSSTVQLEVNPAELMEIQRQVLAAVLYRGHDCTQLGIQTEPDGIVGQRHHDDYKGRLQRFSNGTPVGPLTLLRPDLDGLRAAIAALLTERASARADRTQKAADARTAADAAIKELIGAELAITTVGVHLDPDGHACHRLYEGDGLITRDVPVVPHIDHVADASSELREQYDALRDGIAMQRQAILSEAEPEMRRIVALRKAAKAAKKTEYDALYARLPQTLRERHDAGYAQRDEVERELRKLARHDAGYKDFAGWKDSTLPYTLTDDEFVALQRAKEVAPSGAKVEAREVWDVAYREAQEDDEPGDIDEGGDVSLRENERRVAVVTWSRGGVEVTATVPLT